MKTFTGKYANDGKVLRLRVRKESGHRCVRCGHPFESGKHGKGEWSPCDEKCTHGPPIANDANGSDADALYNLYPKGSAGDFVKRGGTVFAQWRILTVHHFDGDKGNDAWWNTMALCQRCHLQVQTKVDPRQPYFFEHSEWAKPYIAGFYAKKYEDKDLNRDEVMARLDELLAYELA